MSRMASIPRYAMVALAALLIGVPAAQAAFPGTNGEIAFERADDILLMTPGGDPVPLVTAGVLNDRPAISPDGSTIAYQSEGPDERNDIRAIRFDGTGDVSLSDVSGGPYADQHPAWSPDGMRIAFSSAASGTTDIWVMNADGTNRVRVAQAGNQQRLLDPAWSPDGSTIAYTIVSTQLSVPPPPTITTVSVNPPGAPVGYQTNAQKAAWSPDGSRISYTAPVGQTTDVFADTFPTKQAQPTRITSVAATDLASAFSPDGTRILFASNRSTDGVPRLYSAASTGTEADVVQMTFPAGAPGDFYSDWGPARAGMPAPPIPPPPPDPGPQQLGPPQRGKTVNADPVSGEVFVKLPEGATEKRRYAWANAAGGLAVPKGFIPLTEARQLPVRTVFDTSRGVVGLTVARNLLGTRTQHGEFSRGRFVWKQPETKALTTLVMRGGGLKGCRKRRGPEKVTTAGARRRRSIFGRGTGRFRTRGRRSTATVRGTEWVQKDTCRGTLTVVREGTVVVRDVAKRRPVILSTVQKRKRTRHFARAPRFR